MGVIEALERYVAALEELGSVTPALLRPGTPRDEVEAKLVASGVHAHPDVVDLYSWSSGTGDDGPPLFVDLRLISFSSALRIRNDMLEVARQAALDHEQASPDDYFRSSWISFGWSAPDARRGNRSRADARSPARRKDRVVEEGC